MTALAGRLLGDAWAALEGPSDLLDRVRLGGPDHPLPSRLAVSALAQATAGAAGLAAAELASARGARLPGVQIDSRAAAVACRSERYLLLDGEPQVDWDPLSRFLPAVDGWVRLHGNYPHHRARLLAALGIAGDAPDLPMRVAEAVAGRPAAEVEEAIFARNGVAAAVRAPSEWAAHPQGAAVSQLPLLALRRVGAAPPWPLPPAPDRPLLPAAGLRVLDLTRVLAGPVCCRTLAFLGADVLRVDNPRLPEIRGHHLDTGWGKRSALLDLADSGDLATFERLLAGADAVVTGYRPGALDGLGLSPEALIERRPGLVVGTLSAWSRTGPWADRRGFDSLVQAATGIARVEGGPSPEPGTMPAQALDHGTGYLLAAAILRALAQRTTEGGSWHAQLSLAQTACWLLNAPHVPEPQGDPIDPSPWLEEVDTPAGRITHALPPIELTGGPTTWEHPVVPWGSSTAFWR
jgi:hypothetical protein